MSEVNDKIKNALNDYNKGLQKKIEARFVDNDELESRLEEIPRGVEVTIGKDEPRGGIWFDTNNY